MNLNTSLHNRVKFPSLVFLGIWCSRSFRNTDSLTDAQTRWHYASATEGLGDGVIKHFYGSYNNNSFFAYLQRS